MSPAENTLSTDVLYFSSALTLPLSSYSTPRSFNMPVCCGCKKPIASVTSSHGMMRSVPGSSAYLGSLPASASNQPISTTFNPVTLPLSSPTNSLDCIAHSLAQPSSCEVEVRSIIGQFGQGVCSFFPARSEERRVGK